jgi:hypothetical protein
MTDEELASDRRELALFTAGYFRQGGASKDQLLRLFPSPAGEWAEMVEAAFDDPQICFAAGGAGFRGRLTRHLKAAEGGPPDA